MALEWATKLRRYVPVEERRVKPNPSNAKDPKVARINEGVKLMKLVPPTDRLIVLDERGRDVRSEDVAGLLAAASEEGCKGLTFAVGGPYGHAPDVRARADECIKLSSLVLNHEVARVVLLEQLYRAWTIMRGEPCVLSDFTCHLDEIDCPFSSAYVLCSFRCLHITSLIICLPPLPFHVCRYHH